MGSMFICGMIALIWMLVCGVPLASAMLTPFVLYMVLSFGIGIMFPVLVLLLLMLAFEMWSAVK